MKRNGLILSGVGVATVSAAATYLLKDKTKRDKIGQSVKDVYAKCVSMFSKENIEEAKEGNSKAALTSTENDTNPSKEAFPIEKAGNPDPHDIEDNKMVDEGSQYAVQYHDDKKDESK
ncbi:hypothetical protein [Metabacillus sp. RGM 3146]|uniref:hypothetical protein n=1 Tax=Metabacillus sp. RGM 3146 TaxID=3401092 RepID=UPI003B9AE2A1